MLADSRLEHFPDPVNASDRTPAALDQAAQEDELARAPNDLRAACNEIPDLRGGDEMRLQLRGRAVRRAKSAALCAVRPLSKPPASWIRNGLTKCESKLADASTKPSVGLGSLPYLRPIAIMRDNSSDKTVSSGLTPKLSRTA